MRLGRADLALAEVYSYPAQRNCAGAGRCRACTSPQADVTDSDLRPDPHRRARRFETPSAMEFAAASDLRSLEMHATGAVRRAAQLGC